MKQKIYLTVFFCTILQFCFAQRRVITTKDSLHSQHWGTSCWAAATANVVNFYGHVVDECQIIDVNRPPNIEYGEESMCNNKAECEILGSRRLLIDGIGFIELLKKYASFSSLKKRKIYTLSYLQIQSLVNKNKPMIHWFDFDVSLDESHVVNIIGYNSFVPRKVEIAGQITPINIDKNHQKWLYIYDPKPNCVGTYYLKNYQTYQLTSPFGGAAYQNTFFNFHLKKTTRSKTYHRYFDGRQYSTNNIYTPEGDSLAFIKKWFTDFWNLMSVNNKIVKKMTGLDKGVINGSDLLLGSPLDIHRVEYRDSAKTKIQQIIVREDAIEKVIPVLKCAASDTIPTFIAAIIVRHSPTDTTQIVIDRIQALNIPESVVREIRLGCPTKIGKQESTSIKKPDDLITMTIGGNFINTTEGFQFFEYKDKIYDINTNMLDSRGVSKDIFYRKVGNISENHKTVMIDKATVSNTATFLDVLKNKGFEVNNLNKVKINGKYIDMSDLQKQVQESYKSKSIKQIILFNKN